MEADDIDSADQFENPDHVDVANLVSEIAEEIAAAAIASKEEVIKFLTMKTAVKEEARMARKARAKLLAVREPDADQEEGSSISRVMQGFGGSEEFHAFVYDEMDK